MTKEEKIIYITNISMTFPGLEIPFKKLWIYSIQVFCGNSSSKSQLREWTLFYLILKLVLFYLKSFEASREWADLVLRKRGSARSGGFLLWCDTTEVQISSSRPVWQLRCKNIFLTFLSDIFNTTDVGFFHVINMFFQNFAETYL